MGPAAGSGSIRGCLALLTKAIGRAASGRLPSPPLPLCLRPPLPPSLSESPSPKTPSIASSPPRLRRPKPMDGLSSSSSDDILGGGLSCVREDLFATCWPSFFCLLHHAPRRQTSYRASPVLCAVDACRRRVLLSEPQLSRPKARRSTSRTTSCTAARSAATAPPDQ